MQLKKKYVNFPLKQDNLIFFLSCKGKTGFGTGDTPF